MTTLTKPQRRWLSTIAEGEVTYLPVWRDHFVGRRVAGDRGVIFRLYAAGLVTRSPVKTDRASRYHEVWITDAGRRALVLTSRAEEPRA